MTQSPGRDRVLLATLCLVIAAFAVDVSTFASEPAKNVNSFSLQRPRLLSVDGGGKVVPNKSRAIISPADIIVPSNIPFDEQLKRHAVVLQKLMQVAKQALANKADARSKRNFDDYLAAEQDLDNVQKAMVPYAVAEVHAKALIKEGYRMNDLTGKICHATACQPIESITAYFFFTGKREGLGPLLRAGGPHGARPAQKDDTPCPGGQNGDICVNGFNVSEFVRFLSDKPLDLATFGLLPAIRDALIDPDSNGEIAQWIRDPGKRTVEIVQKWRDGILGDDNGEVSKIIRDPIKCTIGRLWGGC